VQTGVPETNPVPGSGGEQGAVGTVGEAVGNVAVTAQRRNVRAARQVPDTDGAIETGRSQPGAVGMKRHVADRPFGSGPFGEGLAGRAVPEAQAAVAVAGGELAAVTVEGGTWVGQPVPCRRRQHPALVAAAQVPERDVVQAVHGRELLAPRVPGDAADNVEVVRQDGGLLTGSEVPHPDRAVPGSRRDLLAVRVEGHVVNERLVTAQDALALD